MVWFSARLKLAHSNETPGFMTESKLAPVPTAVSSSGAPGSVTYPHLPAKCHRPRPFIQYAVRSSHHVPQ